MRARLPGVAGGDRRAGVRRGRPAARARSSTSCPAWGRRSPGRGRCSRSAPTSDLDETLGVALKVREDLDRVRERAGAPMVSERRRRGSRTWGCAARARRARRGRRAARRAPRAGGGRRRLARRGVPRAARRAVLRARRPRASSTPRSRRCSAAGARPDAQDPLEALGPIARAALPGSPPPATGRRRGPRTRAASRPRGATRSCCCTKDFADYTDAERAAARRCWPGSPAAGPRARSPAHAARRRRGATSPTCGRRCARRCATAASCSSAATARPRRAAPAGAGRRRVRLDGALRADAAAVRCRRASPRARGWRRSRSAPG